MLSDVFAAFVFFMEKNLVLFRGARGPADRLLASHSHACVSHSSSFSLLLRSLPIFV